MDLPKITYKADDGLIEISVDGVLVAEWGYEDNPEDNFNEFVKVFEAGMSFQKRGD